MEFILYPAQSKPDLDFFNEEEYQSALENEILMEDRAAADARETFHKDLSGYIESLTNNQIIVAKSTDGEYAGMIWLAEHTSKEPWDFSPYPGWIYDIRVRAKFRGNGLGHLLLKEAEAWAAACGYREIGLQVFGSNPIAINLYESNGYQTEYCYLQKDLPIENSPKTDYELHFRKYDPEKDAQFTQDLLRKQFTQRARAKSAAGIDDGKISSGFRHCLDIYNFGNEKKELIVAEDTSGAPSGILWFYKSKGDLGTRRYIWLHAAQTRNPDLLPEMLRYLEGWAVDNQLDAVRTPLHTWEGDLDAALEAFDYHPTNLFMLKELKPTQGLG